MNKPFGEKPATYLNDLMVINMEQKMADRARRKNDFNRKKLPLLSAVLGSMIWINYLLMIAVVQLFPRPPVENPFSPVLTFQGMLVVLALFNFILAPLALITGLIALFQIRKNNEYNGDAKYAIFGTIAGGVQMLGFAVLLLWIMSLH